MGKRNKKTIRKLDLKTLRAVKAGFALLGTNLYAESKKLGFHHDLGKRALTGETQGEMSLKRKQWLIRVSKGLPHEEVPKEPETLTTAGKTT